MQELIGVEGYSVKVVLHRTAALLAALAAVLIACGEAAPLDQTVSPSPLSTDGVNERATATENGSLQPVTMYVSNQSFDDPTVAVTIRVDGEVVVDRQFDVEGQHNWVEFELALPVGEHELVASSDTGVEDSFTFAIQKDEPLWLVVDYWWSGGGQDAAGDEGQFTFRTSDEPVGFA